MFVTRSLVVLLSLGLCLACGEGSKPSPAGKVVAPEVEKKKVSAKMASGQEVEVELGAGELPTDFPKDFPIHAGSVVVAAMAMPGEGTLVNFRVPSDAEEVFSFYGEELPKRGWHVREQDDSLRNITAAKEGQVARVNVREVGESVTEVGVSVD